MNINNKLRYFKSAVAFFFLFFLHGTSIGNGQQGISYNGKGFAMCGLCAKYFQPHIAKPVLYDVVDLKLIK